MERDAPEGLTKSSTRGSKSFRSSRSFASKGALTITAVGEGMFPALNFAPLQYCMVNRLRAGCPGSPTLSQLAQNRVNFKIP